MTLDNTGPPRNARVEESARPAASSSQKPIVSGSQQPTARGSRRPVFQSRAEPPIPLEAFTTSAQAIEAENNELPRLLASNVDSLRVAVALDDDEQVKKEAYLEEDFPDWSWRDFQQFVRALEANG